MWFSFSHTMLFTAASHTTGSKLYLWLKSQSNQLSNRFSLTFYLQLILRIFVWPLTKLHKYFTYSVVVNQHFEKTRNVMLLVWNGLISFWWEEMCLKLSTKGRFPLLVWLPGPPGLFKLTILTNVFNLNVERKGIIPAPLARSTNLSFVFTSIWKDWLYFTVLLSNMQAIRPMGWQKLEQISQVGIDEPDKRGLKQTFKLHNGDKSSRLKTNVWANRHACGNWQTRFTVGFIVI